MPYKITGRDRDKLRLDPAANTRDGLLHKEKVGCTDRALGLREGTEIEKGMPSYDVTRFSNQLPLIGGQKPDIDRNPYNFVSIPQGPPWWADQKEETAGHDVWPSDGYSGRIRFTATARTPVFVPEGFPFGEREKGEDSDSDEAKEVLRTTPRQFFRWGRVGEDFKRYAIPGSSLKGVLRSGVEALANDRFGAANREFYEKPIPYRRRCFQVGIVERRNPDGSFAVCKVQVTPAWSGGSGKVLPNRGGLLWLLRNGKPTTVVVNKTGPYFTLDAKWVKAYQDNLEHEHYKRHLDAEVKKPADKAYVPDPKRTIDGVRSDLARIDVDTLIYFTADSACNITSFGKNVNYLWPAEKSVQDLAGDYLPPKDPSYGLGKNLGIAQLLFGFVSDHNREKRSHPFRGKVRIETLWGPADDKVQTILLELAPLTAPQTRAKSRPLYLVPGNAGLSASYSDSKPRLRGRKFYWHQTVDGANLSDPVWPGHLNRDEMSRIDRADVPKQLPPPIHAVPAGTKFEGVIHFDNLKNHELGVLLFALFGENDIHCLKIGKGKPRGLGSMRFELQALEILEPDRFYGSLEETNPFATKAQDTFVAAFKEWCKRKSNGRSFEQIDHIRDYTKLHTWPRQASVRYYPINFSQYGWLPADNMNPDEPSKRRPRPLAMKLARDLNP